MIQLHIKLPGIIFHVILYFTLSFALLSCDGGGGNGSLIRLPEEKSAAMHLSDLIKKIL